MRSLVSLLRVVPVVPAVAAALCLAPGCGAGGTTGLDDEAIQAGAVDRGDPAVGLVWLRGGGFCTGTLIAPDVVLTAGHCVAAPVSAFYTGAGTPSTSVGPSPVPGLVGHKVADQVAHPSYRAAGRCPNATYDVALLLLERPIAGVEPLALASSAPRVGASCRTVGYGVHNQGAVQVVEQKRSATETVATVQRSAIRVLRGSGIVDHGDSGGPLLCGKRVAGTTSCGASGGGPDSRDAWYGRVDELEGWVSETIAGWR